MEGGNSHVIDMTNKAVSYPIRDVGAVTTPKLVSEMLPEEGKVIEMEGKIEEKVTDLGRFDEEKSVVKPSLVEGMQWETASCQVPKLILDGSLAPQFDLKVKEVGPSLENTALGPLALSFDDKKGWIAKTLGLTIKHWKGLARENNKQTSQVSESPTKGKRDGPIPLQELDPNSGNLKRRKGSKEESHNLNGENEKVGGVAVAAV
nr:hypothetical protein CFP56_42558 [Quercus suber]